jgi:uncharacterized protein (TIGR03437 family)
VYHGSVQAASATAQTIAVTLYVIAPPSTAPGVLSFASPDGRVPADQTVKLSLGGPAAVAGIGTAVASGNWLNVAPTGDALELRVSANPSGLKDGVYAGFTLAYSATPDCSGVRPPGLEGSPRANRAAPASEALVTASADLNGDGIPDLIVVDQQAATVTVSLGGKTGAFTFATQIPLPVSLFPYLLAVGDINGDGRPDLAISGDSVTVLLGDGAGGFSPAAYSPLPMAGLPAVAGGAANALPAANELALQTRGCTSYAAARAAAAPGDYQIIPVTLRVGKPLDEGQGNDFTWSPVPVFTYVTGGGALAPQNITIGSVVLAEQIPFTAAPDCDGSCQWLGVGSPNSGTTGTAENLIQLTVNSDALSDFELGTYTDESILLSDPDNGDIFDVMPVTLNVTAPWSASSQGVAFTGIAGGSTPQSQTVTLTTSTPYGLNYTATATSSGNWLFVNPQSGRLGGDFSSVPLSLSINGDAYAYMAPGVYMGSITVTVPNGSPASQTINVTLTIGATLTPSTNLLSYYFLAGQGNPPGQPLSISSSYSGIPLTVAVETEGSGNWVSLSPPGGSAPASFTVSVDPSAVTPLITSIYTAIITIDTVPSIGMPAVVGVSLTVDADFVLDNAFLIFNAPVGGAAPAAQSVQLSSNGVITPFTTGPTTNSGGSWLFASPPEGVTPQTLSVSVNQAGLGVGTYTGAVNINPLEMQGCCAVRPRGGLLGGRVPAPRFVRLSAGHSTSTESTSVAVTLNVTATLSAAPSSLSFSALLGASPPASQSVSVTAGGSAIPFTASSSAGWLVVSPPSGTIPTSLSVSVNLTGLAAGTYNGTVLVSSPLASNGPQTVSVSLTVTAPQPPPPNINVSPWAFSLVYTIGQAGASGGAFSVVADDGSSVPFASAAGASWLAVSPSSGSTPSTVNFSVIPAGLVPGVYSGSVVVSSTAAADSPQIVSVALTVLAPLAVSPASLGFVCSKEGSAPAPQTLSATSAGAAPAGLIATSSAAWLTATVGGGGPAGTITVAVNQAGLATGVYSGTLTISSSNAAAVTVGVTLTVVDADLVLSSSGLAFSGSGSAGGAASQYISVTSSANDALPFRVSASLQGAASGAITVSPASATTPALVTVTVDPTAVPVGAYSGQIVFTMATKTYTVGVSLTVQNASPVLYVAPANLTLTPQSGAAAGNATLVIQNQGGGASQQFSVAVTSGAWLSVSPSSGILSGSVAASVQVTANLQGLSAGPYQGSIHVQMGTLSQDVPVSLLVVGGQPYIGLEFQGVLFEARAGAGLSYSRNVEVINRGGGTLNPAASLSGGAGWLSLTQNASGFTLTTQSQSLPAGTYYATVVVADPNAGNSPQQLTVVLNVTPASVAPTPDLSPGGLLFVGVAGGSAPPAQVVQVFTSSVSATAFQASAQAADGLSWLSATPAAGATSATSTGTVTVSVNPSKLNAGVYQGGISVSESSADVRTVNVTFIVLSGAVTSSEPLSVRSAAASSCAPSQLVPVSTGLANNFRAPAGWPTPVTIQLVDDCGNTVSNGNIVLGFSKGAPNFLAMTLMDSAHAVYAATWVPSASVSQVNVLVQATAGALRGTTQLTGAIESNTAPILNQGATLRTVQGEAGAPLAPGTLVQIFGSNLSQSTVQPSSLPLPTNINGTQVLIGGLAAPLYYISSGEVDAQVPLELAPRAGYPIVVSVNGALTVPDTINLVAAEPGVIAFPTGIPVAQHANYNLITADDPAVPGEAIILYLVGMGDTNPPVPSGSPAPSQQPFALVTTAPQVTVAGAPATVLFAGMTPGAVGLYQVNIVVPAQAATGLLPLAVTQGQQSANQTTLPVQAQ